MKKQAMILSKNIAETKRIAREFAVEILKIKTKRAQVVALSGDLGAGKTAFVKEAGRFLGAGKKINSPTFVIIKKYPLRSKKHKAMFHIDAYRLKSGAELTKLGWQEIIADPEHLVFIEWPERVERTMPQKYHHVLFSHTSENHRNIEIKIRKVQ